MSIRGINTFSNRDLELISVLAKEGHDLRVIKRKQSNLSSEEKKTLEKEFVACHFLYEKVNEMLGR